MDKEMSSLPGARNDFYQTMLRLKQLLHRKTPFDYVSHVRGGPALFVGEGNMSFALSLANRVGRSARNITATTYEASHALSDRTRRNATSLQSLGAQVMHSVDAARLNDTFRTRTFNLIGFQFPNVASREPVHGRNPNHILVRRFLRSAYPRLRFGGMVAITVVNSPHYDGAFDMEGAAKRTKFELPVAYPFNFADHPGYSHVNTADQNESAAEAEDDFVTFILRPKRQI